MINFGQKVDLSTKVENLLGVNIYHHGTPKNIDSFYSTLEPLLRRYDVGDELEEIHLLHSHSDSDPLFNRTLNKFKENPFLNAITRPAIPGLNKSMITFSLPNIRANYNVNSPGWMVESSKGLLSDVTTHEFGHVLHNKMVRDSISFGEDFQKNINQIQVGRKSFFSSVVLPAPYAIDSRYAATSPEELFAETFARARLGTGVGVDVAASSMSKILANKKNVVKSLAAMGSALR